MSMFDKDSELYKVGNVVVEKSPQREYWFHIGHHAFRVSPSAIRDIHELTRLVIDENDLHEKEDDIPF